MPIFYGFGGSPPCRAVLIGAAALDLTVIVKNVDLAKGDHLTTEFLKINPLHSVPVLDDNGTIVVDSHAILAYMAAKYGKDDSLYPKDLVKKALVDTKLYFETGYVFSLLGKIFKAHAYEGQTEFLTSKQAQEIQDVYGFLNTFLKDNKWITGDYLTVADISLFSSVSSLEYISPIERGKYPNIRRWLDNAKKVPCFETNAAGLRQFRDAWLAVTKH